MDRAELQERYSDDAYYWGTEPNDLAATAVEYVEASTATGASDAPVAVDVGAGEGRDAVYLAEEEFRTYAVDPVPAGLEKAERLADERGVEVETRRGDVNDLELPERVDLFYSIGTLQYLRPENREAQFRRFRDATREDGVHAVFAFVDHPEVATAPDWGDDERFYAQGELRGYYDDWEILEEDAFVFDDDSDGEPHRHAAEVVVARKP